MIATPATVFPDKEGTYTIEYHELLAYAKRISAFTLPPGGYVDDLGVGGGIGGGGGLRGGVSTVEETGLRTPPEGGGDATPVSAVAAMTAVVPGNMNGNGTVATENPDTTTNGNAMKPTTTALPEAWHSYLNPHADISWVPWPTEERIRQGGLASLQYILDTGGDISAVADTNTKMEGIESTAAAANTEANNNADMEKEKMRVEKEEMVRKEVERARSVAEGASRQPPQPPPEQEKMRVFGGLDVLDDD